MAILALIGVSLAMPAGASVSRPENETRLSPFGTSSGKRLSPYVSPAAARSALKKKAPAVAKNAARPTAVSGTTAPRVPDRVARTGGSAVALRGVQVGRPQSAHAYPGGRPVTLGGGSNVPRVLSGTSSPAGAAEAGGADEIRFSSPSDLGGDVAFSRPTMILDDPPPSPRPRQLGAGWIAGRAGGSGGGGGGGGQPQPRPAAPGPIVAEVVEEGQIALSWQDLSTNEEGFTVEHQVQVLSVWQLAGSFTTPPGRENMLVTVTTGVHRFRVIAFNSGGNSTPSEWSTPVNVEEPVEPAPLPAAPSNLVVEDTGLRTVRVSWDDVSTNETGFEVEREPVFSNGNRTVGANTTSTNDSTGLGTFRYRVRSFNAAGQSAWTSWGTVVIADAPPSAPTSLLAQDAGNERDVRLTWTDTSDNEEGFALERQQQVASVWGPSTALAAAANATMLADDPGAGTFRYRIRAGNAAGDSAWSEWATATVTSGWTEFTPSADTRIVYVSSSEGNDTNDGLSPERAKRTIAAGKALLRDGYPDWMLLKRGDVWDETLGTWIRSGRSAAEMMVVSTYGSAAARPLLRTGIGMGFYRVTQSGTNDRVDYLAVMGLHFVPHTRTTESAYGFRWLGNGRNILLEDCKIEGYKDNITIEGYNGIVDNFIIRRCVVLDSYSVSSHSQGLFPSIVNGLVIEECVFDHNGWSETVEGADPTRYNRNIYIDRSCGPVVLRGNILARSASEAVQMRSGGLCENNLMLKNSAGLMFGQHQSRWPDLASGGIVRNNVVLDAQNTGADPRGFGIQLQQVDGVEVYGNIVAHQRHGTGNIFAYTLEYNCRNVSLTQNIAYDWRHPTDGTSNTLLLSATMGGQITIADNRFQQPFAGQLTRLAVPHDGSIVSYSGNRYFAPTSSSAFYVTGTGSITHGQWVATTGEANSVVGASAFPDPARDIASYMASLGHEATLEAFLAEARQQSRLNWRREFTAAAVNAYIRDGFGVEPLP